MPPTGVCSFGLGSEALFKRMSRRTPLQRSVPEAQRCLGYGDYCLVYRNQDCKAKLFCSRLIIFDPDWTLELSGKLWKILKYTGYTLC